MNTWEIILVLILLGVAGVGLVLMWRVDKAREEKRNQGSAVLKNKHLTRKRKSSAAAPPEESLPARDGQPSTSAEKEKPQ